MLEAAAAQDLEETLCDVEASVGDLISAKDFESMAAITFEFGESTLRPQDIADLVGVGFLRRVERRFLLWARLCLRLRRSMQLFLGIFYLRLTDSSVCFPPSRDGGFQCRATTL
jgi:hypothetical protein